MRGRGRFLILSLVFALSFGAVPAVFGDEQSPLVSETGPVYPWHTRFFTPYFRSSLITPFQDGGGELAGGLMLSPIKRTPGLADVTGGYRFYGGDLVTPYVGIGGGYHFSLFDKIGLIPKGGIHFTFPIEEKSTRFSLELYAETHFQVHLHSRSFLFLQVGVTVPFASPAPPAFSFGLGIQKSHPVMVPLKRLRPELEITPDRFSPDGDGEQDTLYVHVKSGNDEAVAAWTLRIYDPRENLFYNETGTGAPPQPIDWNGRSGKGELVSSASTYTVELTLIDVLGRSVRRRGEVLVDILLIRERGKLKIRIPNITFPPNSADFSLLSKEEVIEKNREVLQRLTEIFARFPEYSIVIEGHANMEHYEDSERARREQEQDLIPLSLKRAQAVKEVLISLGMDPDRLSTVGLGAKYPLVPFSDEQNRWKNRRVEFILEKPDAQK